MGDQWRFRQSKVRIKSGTGGNSAVWTEVTPPSAIIESRLGKARLGQRVRMNDLHRTSETVKNSLSEISHFLRLIHFRAHCRRMTVNIPRQVSTSATRLPSMLAIENFLPPIGTTRRHRHRAQAQALLDTDDGMSMHLGGCSRNSTNKLAHPRFYPNLLRACPDILPSFDPANGTLDK